MVMVRGQNVQTGTVLDPTSWLLRLGPHVTVRGQNLLAGDIMVSEARAPHYGMQQKRAESDPVRLCLFLLAFTRAGKGYMVTPDTTELDA